MKLSTVNVICFVGNDFQSVDSFSDDEEGNVQAEKLFTEKILECGCPADDAESYVEDGFFQERSWTNGNKFYLTHTV